MPLIYDELKPLWRDGKPVWHQDCCCDPCYKCCFYVHGAYSGYPNEPTATPPLTTARARGTARVVYHGHNQDTDSDPDGSFYHAHLWILEWCFTIRRTNPALGPQPSSQDMISDFEHELSLWAQNGLPLSWIGTTDDPAGDITGHDCSCSDSFITIKKAALLYAPIPNVTTDLYGPIDRDQCPECPPGG